MFYQTRDKASNYKELLVLTLIYIQYCR